MTFRREARSAPVVAPASAQASAHSSAHSSAQASAPASALVLALVLIAVAALTKWSGATASAAPLAQSDGACQSVGWRPIEGPDGSFSALAGSADLDSVYVGSRDTSDDPDRMTLFHGSVNSTSWQNMSELIGIRISDVVLTPGKATEAWISTFGYSDDFDGNVFGRAGSSELTPRGSLKTWFMQLAATPDDVYAAVSKPGEKGVYRWDEPSGEWLYVGGDTIPSDYFRQFEAGFNGKLWLGTDSQGLWLSEDMGVTWTLSRGAGETVWSLAVSPTEPNRVMVGLGPPNDGAAGYPRGVRVTQDGGETWTTVATPGLAQAQYVSALAFGMRSPGDAYAAAWDDGLFVSSNYGQSWRGFTAPEDQSGLFNSLLTIKPQNQVGCDLLYAAGANGVWVRNLAPGPNPIYVPIASNRADLTNP